MSQPFDAASTKSSSATNRCVRLHDQENEAVQIIHPSANAKVSIVDLRGFSPSERDAEMPRLAAEESERPFDLSRAPSSGSCCCNWRIRAMSR